MQEKIAKMKQANFSGTDKLKAIAIVNIFETGKPFGNYAACVVLNDGAGISYGINQFTHRSGSLLAVVEKYLENGGVVGQTLIENALPLLRRNEPVIVRSLAADEALKKALRAAAITREMREAQLHVAFERYLKPAVEACEGSGFILPLSLAVIYDSITHGSYERIRDSVRVTPTGVNSETGITRERVALTYEKSWITEYVRRRDAWLASIPRLNSTRYRTRFFLNQIMLGKWHLDLPLIVNGFRLEEGHIQKLLACADGFLQTAVGPNLEPHTTSSHESIPHIDQQIPASTPQAQPPFVQSTNFSLSSSEKPQAEACTLNNIEKRVNEAAAEFDQADRIATTVITRTDRAKSLWTTVVGTIWQTAWALIGFLAGLPREVWLVVAVIAALLMLFYLYRQIALGKIRELGTPRLER